ncbi:MAG: biopolymer transporter ExbD, partial [Dehalococcoidia bacterium]|nr:biopolymer transporter ExbD [Dehalococcoidia bacterium]
VKAHNASRYEDYVRVIDQLKQANATRISIAESD